jgi:hypothetical protein
MPLLSGSLGSPLGAASGSGTFGIDSAVALSANKVRVHFTLIPQASNNASATDATNPANYLFFGNKAVNVVTVDGDLFSYDITVQTAFSTGGGYSVSVINVQTPQGTTLGFPTSQGFTFTSVPIPVSAGAVTSGIESQLEQFLGSDAFGGDGWTALVAAIGSGDSKSITNAQAAFDQRFKSSASSRYLDRKMSDDGVVRPNTMGLSDDAFRTLGIKYTTGKLTQQSIWNMLSVLYGINATHAFLQTSGGEPFNIPAGSTLTLLIDERTTYTITFAAADFVNPAAATALEVATAITRYLRQQGSTAYALLYKDVSVAPAVNRVRIYSSASGLASAIRITGGTVLKNLQFTAMLNPYPLSGVYPQWAITNTSSGSRLTAAFPINYFKGSERMQEANFSGSGITVAQVLSVPTPVASVGSTTSYATSITSGFFTQFALYNIASTLTYAFIGAVTWSVWVRSVAGTLTFKLELADNTQSGGVTVTQTFTATTTWQRFSLTYPSQTGTNNPQRYIEPRIYPSASTGGTVYVWGAQLETGTTMGPYSQTPLNNPTAITQNLANALHPSFTGWTSVGSMSSISGIGGVSGTSGNAATTIGSMGNNAYIAQSFVGTGTSVAVQTYLQTSGVAAGIEIWDTDLNIRLGVSSTSVLPPAWAYLTLFLPTTVPGKNYQFRITNTSGFSQGVFISSPQLEFGVSGPSPVFVGNTSTSTVSAGNSTPAIDVSILHTDDLAYVAGAQFNTNNIGTWPITAVSIANNNGAITQSIDVSGLMTPETQTQTAASDILFIRPVKQTIQNGTRTLVVSQLSGHGGLAVNLPATSTQVVRGPNSAAYGQSQTAQTIASVYRGSTGTITLTAFPGTSLAAGNQVFVDGIFSWVASPTTNDASGASTYGNSTTVYQTSANVMTNSWDGQAPNSQGSFDGVLATFTSLSDGSAVFCGGGSIASTSVPLWYNTNILGSANLTTWPHLAGHNVTARMTQVGSTSFTTGISDGSTQYNYTVSSTAAIMPSVLCGHKSVGLPSTLGANAGLMATLGGTATGANRMALWVLGTSGTNPNITTWLQLVDTISNKVRKTFTIFTSASNVSPFTKTNIVFDEALQKIVVPMSNNVLLVVDMGSGAVTQISTPLGCAKIALDPLSHFVFCINGTGTAGLTIVNLLSSSIVATATNYTGTGKAVGYCSTLHHNFSNFPSYGKATHVCVATKSNNFLYAYPISYDSATGLPTLSLPITTVLPNPPGETMWGDGTPSMFIPIPTSNIVRQLNVVSGATVIDYSITGATYVTEFQPVNGVGSVVVDTNNKFYVISNNTVQATSATSVFVLSAPSFAEAAINATGTSYTIDSNGRLISVVINPSSGATSTSVLLTAGQGTSATEPNGFALGTGTALACEQAINTALPLCNDQTFLYNPANNTWATKNVSMVVPRCNFGISALSNNTYVITGGSTATSVFACATQAEIYNPVLGTFTGKASAKYGRVHHGQVTLNDGRVLVAGGTSYDFYMTGSALPTWVPYSNGSFGTSPYWLTVAYSLGSGGNVNAQGMKPTQAYVTVAETFNPNSNTWASAGSLTYARVGHGILLLPDGRVMVAGGYGCNLSQSAVPAALNTVEIFDPSTNTWSTAAPMNFARQSCKLLYLPKTNRVLVVGGVPSYSSPLPNGQFSSITANTSAGNTAFSITDINVPPVGSKIVIGDAFTEVLTVTSATITNGTSGSFTTSPTLQGYGGGSAVRPWLSSAEEYDLKTGTWCTVPNMNLFKTETNIYFDAQIANGHILDNSTLALWRLDESGGTIFNSSSFGSTYDLVNLSTPAPQPILGKIGNARTISSTLYALSNTFAVGDQAVLTLQGGTFTAESWFWIDTSITYPATWPGSNNGHAALLSLAGAGNGTSFLYGLDATGFFVYNVTNGFTSVGSWAALQTGTWHHLAVRCTSSDSTHSTTDFFLDGVKIGTTTILKYALTPSSVVSWNLGGESSAFNRFTGRIDDVRFSLNARTDAEIADSYARGAQAQISNNMGLYHLVQIGNFYYYGGERVGTTFVPGNDILTSGRMNGLFPIASANPANGRITYASDALQCVGLAAGASATLTPASAIASSVSKLPGPYVYEPASGFGLTSISTTTTTNYTVGQIPGTLFVGSTAGFTDAAGFVIVAHGTSAQQVIPYIGVRDTTTLLLSPTYAIKSAIPSGSFVGKLSTVGGYAPANPQSVGSLYLTASSIARITASSLLDSMIAGGLSLDKTILFPGDRGLGNEGRPTTTVAKLSDVVRIFGSDSLDTEITALQSGTISST